MNKIELIHEDVLFTSLIFPTKNKLDFYLKKYYGKNTCNYLYIVIK